MNVSCSNMNYGLHSMDSTAFQFSQDASVLGTDFYVMEFVGGTIFLDPNLPQLSAHQRKSVYECMSDTLALLHSVDPMAAGLKDLGSPVNYGSRQLHRWSRQYMASVQVTQREFSFPDCF